MHTTLKWMPTIVFLSGFCSLVYQVTWLRLLRLIFGASTPATAVVLAIFMGGLGLGGLLFGRRAERARDPLALYARIEIGIALAAAASPLLVWLARQLYLGLGGVSVLGLAGATLLRILLSVMVLGVPATLMGGTLPAVAQAMESSSDRGRRLVATFYGVNTLGAVAGAFLTTFVLIELLGVRQSLWLVAALNLLLGLQVRAMARSRREAEPSEVSPLPADTVAPDPQEPHKPHEPVSAAWVVLLAAFVVGFVFFQMEIVWYRMLAPVLGGTLYTFGLILTVALAGIGTGGWFYSLGSRARRPTLRALALTCGLEALFVIVPFALGDRLAHLSIVVQSLAAQGFAALTLGWTSVTAIVVLPTAVIAGYQFPQLVALLGEGRRQVGSQVGLAYAWNTWGAILGSLAGGFLLLPLLSAPTLWRLSAVLLALTALALWLAAGLAAAAVGPAGAFFRGRSGVACASVSLLLCLAPGPSAFWRHSEIGAGRSGLEGASSEELKQAIHSRRQFLLKEAEGVESSVALARANGLSLMVNGKSDGAVSDAPTTILLGMLGAFLHPAPETNLVIGLGTGMTAGWLARVPGVDRVDVVELEPSVVELAREFKSMTFDVTELGNVRMIFGDGREVVRASDETYDLIISEPSNPYRAGVADLFSREFYLGARQRLAEDGLLVQWLQTYEVDDDVVGIAFSTLGSVFEHVEVWQVHRQDLLLVASARPYVHDFDRVRRRAEIEPYRAALRHAWRLSGAEGLYSAYLGDSSLVQRIARQGRGVSTDDRPLIEFGFARNLGRNGLFQVTDLQEMAEALDADRPAGQGAPIDWLRVRELRQARHATHCYLRQWDAGTLDVDERNRLEARIHYGLGDLAKAESAWFAQDGPPMSLFDRLLVADLLATTGNGGGAPTSPDVGLAFTALREEAATDAILIEASWRWRRGEAEAAVSRLEEGFSALATDPWSYDPIVRRSLTLAFEMARRDPAWAGRLFNALALPFAGYRLEQARTLSRVELARWSGDKEACVEAFEAFEPHVIWEEFFLFGRRACYMENNHPLAGAASAQLEEFYAAKPRPLFEPSQNLAAPENLEKLLDGATSPLPE